MARRDDREQEDESIACEPQPNDAATSADHTGLAGEEDERLQPAGQAKPRRRIGRWIALVLAALVALCAIGFTVYVGDYYHAAPENEVYLQSSAEVQVEQAPSFTAFGDPDAPVGFILYPGAKVAADAYAPLLHDLAEQGVFCVVADVPFNIAFFDTNAAAEIIEGYPNVDTWYVGGHSLGGVVASGWASEHADKLAGIVLIASYTTTDLSQSGLRALLLYGSEDAVLNRDAYADARKNLPAGFEETVIEGGNHGQFGNYGEQEGDGKAAISPEEQWEMAAETIAAFMRVGA